MKRLMICLLLLLGLCVCSEASAQYGSTGSAPAYASTVVMRSVLFPRWRAAVQTWQANRAARFSAVQANYGSTGGYSAAWLRRPAVLTRSYTSSYGSTGSYTSSYGSTGGYTSSYGSTGSYTSSYGSTGGYSAAFRACPNCVPNVSPEIDAATPVDYDVLPLKYRPEQVEEASGASSPVEYSSSKMASLAALPAEELDIPLPPAEQPAVLLASRD